MLVNVLQWCTGIGKFYKCTHPLFKIKCSLLLKLGIYKKDLNKILLQYFQRNVDHAAWWY